jgi:hypothetical protein
MAANIFSLLTARGYSPAQAAGIVGNLQQESSLNPTRWGDNGTSYGLAQWHKDRLSGLQDHAAGLGLDPSDPVAQVSYLDWELKNKEGGAYKNLMAAQTPEEAATAFLGFERPRGYSPDNPMGGDGAQNRVANAVSAFNQYAGPGADPGMPPTAPTTPPAGLLAQAAPDASTAAQVAATPLKGLLAPAAPTAEDADPAAPGLLARRKFAGVKIAPATRRTFSFL